MVILKAGTRPPWVGLGAAVWVDIAAGNAYNFPLYSHSLKSIMGFNQQQLTLLGVANDIGENVGILPGIVCNRFPPWAVLLIGGLCCFLGYGVIWLAVSQTVESMPFWVLFAALCVATNSSAWLNTGVLVTNMRNFPLSRGTVAGILKGYVGLSAAVYTEMYSSVLHDSSAALLLVLTLGIPALCLAMMYFVRPCTPASGEDTSEHAHFLFTQASSVILGIYLLITTVLNNVLELSDAISYTLLAITVPILMAPLAIPIKMTFYPSKSRRSNGSSNQLTGSDSDRSPLLTPSPSTTQLGTSQEADYVSDVDMLLAEGEGAVKKKKPRRGDDFTFLEACVKADFWLLFMVYFLGVGSGITVLNNLAQIGIADGVNDTTILLSVFSFCNFAGRLGGGALSEHFVRSKAIPRTVWMTCAQVIMVGTYLLYASSVNGSLYGGTALLGVCYGVQFTIMISAASELFGLKHFGIIYNFMSLGNPIGALIFSSGIAGYVYDKEAAKQSSNSCLGPNCYRLTFFALAGICCLGATLGTVLSIRVRPVYQMLYAGGSFRFSQTISSH